MNAASLDSVLSAVADPTRRAILERLMRGPARVSDVAEPFSISFAAVSKHVNVLENAGLVTRKKEGREQVLTLDARPLKQIAKWTHRYEQYWSERLDRLEDFFKAKGKRS